MIQASKAFYDALRRGEMPEILCILDSNVSRWVFGKVRPSVATSTAYEWDGSRLYGEGTYGSGMNLIAAEASVLTFGNVGASIAYSNKDVMLSLTQVEIGSMQVVFDNASGFFSDLLGEDKAVSFLNFTMTITCGFYSIGFSDSIELFSGTITQELLDNNKIKIIAEANTPTLMEAFTLPKAERYSSPKTGSDILPYVYGDTSENSSQGISVCPCIDTANYVFALCCHALPAGASVAIYADNELVTSGYTLTRSGDYESQGVIAYVTFTAEQTATVTMTTTVGKDSLTNPIDIIEDILDEAGDTTTRNTTAWNQAAIDAAALGYTAAGVLAADQPPSYWMTDILSSFLGSWYLNNLKEVVISLESSRLATSNIAGVLHERDTFKIQGIRTRQNLCNQIAVNYAYSLADVDRRFKQNTNPRYLMTDNGDTTKDADSQNKYGVLTKTLDLNWCRNTAAVNALQARVVARYAAPVWVIDFPEKTFDNLLVEPGDFVLYSWEDQQDRDGLPVKNQIGRVLAVDRDLDALTCTFNVIDYNAWQTVEPYVWDGSHVYGTVGDTYGDTRDRRDF